MFDLIESTKVSFFFSPRDDVISKEINKKRSICFYEHTYQPGRFLFSRIRGKENAPLVLPLSKGTYHFYRKKKRRRLKTSSMDRAAASFNVYGHLITIMSTHPRKYNKRVRGYLTGIVVTAFHSLGANLSFRVISKLTEIY